MSGVFIKQNGSKEKRYLRTTSQWRSDLLIEVNGASA